MFDQGEPHRAPRIPGRQWREVFLDPTILNSTTTPDHMCQGVVNRHIPHQLLPGLLSDQCHEGIGVGTKWVLVYLDTAQERRQV